MKGGELYCLLSENQQRSFAWPLLDLSPAFLGDIIALEKNLNGRAKLPLSRLTAHRGSAGASPYRQGVKFNRQGYKCTRCVHVILVCAEEASRQVHVFGA